MAKARTFEQVLGERIRARREELGLTQDDVARWAWFGGPTFTRSIVAAVERGTRQLTLPEIAALLGALQTDLEGLLRGTGEISLDQGSVDIDLLLNQLHWRPGSHGPLWSISPRRGFLRAFAATHLQQPIGVADTKAAQRLSVTPEAVRQAAYRLWGKSLTEERDERVKATASPDEDPRTLQALRGHVTRGLLEELRPSLKRKKRKT